MKTLSRLTFPLPLLKSKNGVDTPAAGVRKMTRERAQICEFCSCVGWCKCDDSDEVDVLDVSDKRLEEVAEKLNVAVQSAWKV